MASLSSDFFKNEKRDGFIISEVMKRSWAADLSALEDIKGLCEKHSLRFFAIYGTLLGTVRHGGYIPWDDDIDIGMVRDDYIRFLDVVTKELGDKYDVMNPYTRPWYCMNFSHLSNNNDLNFERSYLKQWQGCPFPVGPDVYPYYYIPRDPAEEQYIMNLLEKVDSTMALCRQSAARSAQQGFDASAGLNEAAAIALVELQHETGFEFGTDRPLDNQLEILYDQICRLTEPEDADYVARYDEYAKDRSKKFPKEWLENVVELPFEEISMPVPTAYDAVLKARFGNAYMMPRRERGAHDYPFFKKQLGDLGERLDEGYSENNPIPCLKDMPVHKADGKIAVLFHTTVSGMLIYNEYVPDKIREVLELFSKYSDGLQLCWMAAGFPGTDEIAMDLIAPQLIAAYESIMSEYEAGGGEFAGGDIENIVKSCDVYYGDRGKLAEAFEKAGKPVYIQDYRERALYELKALLDDRGYRINEEDENGHTAAAGDRFAQPERDNRYPESWGGLLYKPGGSRKHVLLYINSVSTLFQYGEQMIEKLKSVLRICYDNRDDVLLIWHPQAAIEQGAELFEEVVYKEYRDIVAEYKTAGWGILVEGEDAYIVAGLADAYYGDADPAAEIVRKAGKPVMIADAAINDIV